MASPPIGIGVGRWCLLPPLESDAVWRVVSISCKPARGKSIAVKRAEEARPTVSSVERSLFQTGKVGGRSAHGPVGTPSLQAGKGAFASNAGVPIIPAGGRIAVASVTPYQCTVVDHLGVARAAEDLFNEDVLPLRGFALGRVPRVAVRSTPLRLQSEPCARCRPATSWSRRRVAGLPSIVS
jgi:hypothetical protein